MKALLIFITVAATACGPESSPEGRMKMKVEIIQRQLDSLKEQNGSMRDSIAKISQEIRKLKYGE